VLQPRQREVLALGGGRRAQARRIWQEALNSAKTHDGRRPAPRNGVEPCGPPELKICRFLIDV